MYNCIMDVLSNMCRSCEGTVTAIAAHLQTCFLAGNLVQRSIERVTLDKVPLDVVCGVVGFFEHVKDLQCWNIKAPQQVCLCNVLLLTHTIQFASFECYSSLEGRTSLLLHLPAIANS